MRISDGSSDVCSSDLPRVAGFCIARISRMPCGLLQASPWSRPPRRRHSIDHLSIIRKEPRMSDANDEYVYDEASGEWLPAVEDAAKAAAARPEERRVGKECVSTVRYRGGLVN